MAGQPYKTWVKIGIYSIGVIVLLAIAVAQYQPPRLVTDMARFYPNNTGLYAEFAPGPKLAAKLFQRLLVFKGWHRDMSHLLAQDFDPQFSFGAWDKAQHPQFLMVLSIKPGITLTKLLRDFNQSPDAFDALPTRDDFPILRKRTGHPMVLSLVGNHLLIAETADVIDTAIRNDMGYIRPSIFNNSVFKPYLKLLAPQRNGTLLADTAQLQKWQQTSRLQSVIPSFWLSFQNQLQPATPVIVANITIHQNQWLYLDILAPLVFDRIQDANLRADLHKLLAQQDTLHTPALLPQSTIAFGTWVGLGYYFDFYRTHLASSRRQTALADATNQLQALGLDLRQDIIGLLDGKTTAAIVNHGTQTDVLTLLNNTPQTAKTVSQLSQLGAQMARGELQTQPIDAVHSIQVLHSPALPFSVAYSTLLPDTLAVGTPDSIGQLYEIQQHKAPSLLQNPLYQRLSGALPNRVSHLYFLNIVGLQNALKSNNGKSLHLPSNLLAARQILQNRMLLLDGIEGFAGFTRIDSDKLIQTHITLKLLTD